VTEAKPFERSCPACGAARTEGERYCPSCGKDLFAISPDPPGTGDGPSAHPPAHRKSIGLTIVLAIIFPGLGHLYAGRIARGLALMAGFAIMAALVVAVVLVLGASGVGLLCAPLVIVVALLLFLPFELWQILDAVGWSAARNMGRA
jgi:hypothetical protein